MRFGLLSLVALVAIAMGGCPILGLTDPNSTGDPNDADGTTKTLHEKIFTEILTDGYEGTTSCLNCHEAKAAQLLSTGHWNWEGVSENIAGFETEVHGKTDLINNFCIAVPSNEGRCTMCHPSYGWQDNTFDFDTTANIDCLVCHDTTATYKKHPTANGGGGPAALVVDGAVTPVGADQLQTVAYNVGEPGRHNCGFCHYSAGGGDNVKHGDLSSDLNNPTNEMDVHMDAAGLDFTCQRCHTVADHGIEGMALHSVDEGNEAADCQRCHTGDVHSASTSFAATLLNAHADKVACQTCHIPTFARTKPTKVEWYWSEAGQDVDPIPTDALGMATYDKKKGRFVYGQSVAPTLMWYDGKWTRKMVGVADTYTEAGTVADPVVLAAPTATKDTSGAKIYPFKKMIGDQPVDTTNKRLIVPHLFGTKGGDNPFWGKYDWGLAIQDGATYTGVDYSGNYGFANTVMYLTINHEVAPASQARDCNTCHGVAGFFEALGYDSDPFPG
jgi:octaheme c-type cytochrome (tetrathionate reductase family)